MKLAYFLKDATASGGMERVLANKCAWWCAHGYQVHVVSLASPQGRKPFFDFPDSVHQHSLGLDALYRSGIGSKLQHRRHATLFVQAAGHWLEQVQPDIAISMFDEYSRHLCLVPHPCPKVGELHFAKHKRAQHMYRLERHAAGRWLGRLYKRADYALIRRYDRFVTLTAQDSRAWGPLPNIATIGNAQTFPCRERAPLQAKRIIALGRHTRQKRFDLLLRAWARIAAHHPDGCLSIIGPGDKSDLQALAVRLGIAGQVELRDAVADVRGVLMESSLLALSSHYEGFGMALVEAMSCGLPVVAMDCHSGPADIITEGVDGFLVAPGDIDALAAAMHRLLDDPALRRTMGAAAWENVQRYSVGTVMGQWQRLLEQLLPAPSG